MKSPAAGQGRILERSEAYSPGRSACCQCQYNRSRAGQAVTAADEYARNPKGKQRLPTLTDFNVTRGNRWIAIFQPPRRCRRHGDGRLQVGKARRPCQSPCSSSSLEGDLCVAPDFAPGAWPEYLKNDQQKDNRYPEKPEISARIARDATGDPLTRIAADCASSGPMFPTVVVALPGALLAGSQLAVPVLPADDRGEHRWGVQPGVLPAAGRAEFRVRHPSPSDLQITCSKLKLPATPLHGSMSVSRRPDGVVLRFVITAVPATT